MGVSITKDFKLSENLGFFMFAGIGNWVGLGITAQSDYNNDGLLSRIIYSSYINSIYYNYSS